MSINSVAIDLSKPIAETIDKISNLTDGINSLNDTIIKSDDAMKKSVEVSDDLMISQSELLVLEKEYQETLKRKIELEKRLNKQSPIFRYSENDKFKNNTKVKQTDETEFISSTNTNPDDTKDTKLENHLKAKRLNDLKSYKAKLDKEKEQAEQSKGMFRKLASKTIGGGVELGSGLIKQGFNQSGRILENAMGLQQIPLYNEAKQLTKFALNKTNKTASDLVSGTKEKLIERKYNVEKQKATREFFSRVSSSNNETKSITHNEKIQKNIADQRKERGENKAERNENKTRHKDILSALDSIKNSILISSLAKLANGLFGAILSGISKMTLGISKIIAGLSSLGMAIIGGMVSGLSFLLKSIFPNIDLDIFDIDKSKRKGKNARSNPDTDKRGKGTAYKNGNTNPDVEPSRNKKIPEPEPKAGNSGNKPISNNQTPPKPDSIRDGIKKDGGKGLIKKVGAKGVVKGALKAVTGPIGWALTAAEIFHYAIDNLEEGEFQEATNNMMKQMSPDNKPLDKIGAIQSGKLSDSERASMSKEEADAIDKKMAEQREKLVQERNQGYLNFMNTNVNKTTNVHMTGFIGMQSNNSNYVPAYGITSNY